jgi:hypothetical protein
MFERKFEFTVPHPIEICEERILDMDKSGCFMQLFQPTKSNATSIKKDMLTEFHIVKTLGRLAGQAEVSGIVEATGKNQCTISGISQVRGMGILLVVFTLIGLSVFIEGLYDQNGWLIGLALVWTPLVWLQFFYYRNNLINMLKKRLNQPKKK